jgi:replication factor C large subunit
MSNDKLPWTEKYRPTTRSDIVGNAEEIETFLDWIISWKTGTPKKRAMLLIGPPGTGKTATVGAIANDLGYEIVEFNASDKRNRANIEMQVTRSALQQTLDGSPRLILLDEVDGLSGTSDRGGVGAILKVIDVSSHPIVMTANDPDSPRIKDLLKKCLVIRFNSLNIDSIIQVLTKIAMENSDRPSQQIIESIAGNSGGDLRAAISDLQSAIQGWVGSSEIGLGQRDTKSTVTQALRKLFMVTDPKTAKAVIDQADIDYDSLLLWFEENLHLHLMAPEELEAGFDSLSEADLYLGRIMRQQTWKLLSYAYDFLSSGIASSRKKTPYRRVEYSEPLWPLLIWKGRRKREKHWQLISRLAETGGISIERAYEEYGRAVLSIVANSPKYRPEFADWLGVRESIFR